MHEFSNLLHHAVDAMSPRRTSRPATLGDALDVRVARLATRTRSDGATVTNADFTRLVVRRFLQYLGEKQLVRPEEDPGLAAVLTPQNARGFVTWLRGYQSTNFLTRTTRPLSARTVRGYASELKTLAHDALREGLVTRDLLAPFDLPHGTSRVIHPYAPEEVAAMLAVIDNWPNRIRNTALLLLLYDSGARSAEVRRLTWADLDLAHRRARVLGKGSAERWIYWGAQTADALERHQTKNGRFTRFTQQVFCTGQGRPMTKASLYQLVKGWAAAAGIAGATVHRFRHSYSTEELRAGESEYQVQLRMGHRHSDMTRRYAQTIAAERPTKTGGPVDRLLGAPAAESPGPVSPRSLADRLIPTPRQRPAPKPVDSAPERQNGHQADLGAADALLALLEAQGLDADALYRLADALTQRAVRAEPRPPRAQPAPPRRGTRARASRD